MRPKRTQRSFAKNGKERKECNVLLQRTEKNARMFRSIAKERENVPVFFQYILLLLLLLLSFINSQDRQPTIFGYLQLNRTEKGNCCT